MNIPSVLITVAAVTFLGTTTSVSADDAQARLSELLDLLGYPQTDVPFTIVEREIYDTVGGVRLDLTSGVRSSLVDADWSLTTGVLRSFIDRPAMADVARRLSRNRAEMDSPATNRTQLVFGEPFGSDNANGGDAVRESEDLSFSRPSCESLLGIDLGRGSDTNSVLTEAQALRVAREWARRLGIQLGTGMEQYFRRHREDEATWNLAWRRVVDGYPFPDEHVGVLITDNSGHLISLRNGTTDRIPRPELGLTAERAKEIAAKAARKILKYHGTGTPPFYPNIQIETPKIKYPNGRRLGGPAPGRGTATTTPKLVYTARIRYEFTRPENTLFAEMLPSVVSISAKDGRILGGSW